MNAKVVWYGALALRILEMEIAFHVADVEAPLRNKARLRALILEVFRSEKVPCAAIAIVFCSDNYLLGINRQFLKHNYYTDIITFNLAAKNEPVNGEVYISIDRVRENADGLGLEFRHELARVIIHGALHLCGYGDKSTEQKAEMTSREDHYLSIFLKKR